ncbi:Signal transduction histidine kinase [Amycolatopsis marina]|uniref:Signal transduction histidine kinase n=1 Tax=Amycolatopsis marina TaxID=490629 RepID=A0A1I0YLR1_9PSEU|nr:histidine kinase [Amycolatopsis marina]SFB14355.1 Signal transduction histidine kinase [Amycolatopsis marina]
MTDSRLERWGLACFMLVCLLVGVPVLLSALQGEVLTTGPGWLWWACYLGYLVLIALTCVQTGTLWLNSRMLVAALIGFGSAVVLLAPRAGWTAILLVFTTALVTHIISLRGVLVVIVAHSALVGGTVVLAGGGFAEIALSALIYATLQACSVWAVLSQLREAAARTHLAVVNTELRAATALLAESSRVNERLHISRELHDLVGHQLTALVLELEVAAHRSTPPASEHVERARGLARDLLGDVRTAVGEIRTRPPQLRQALADIVADLPRPRVRLTVDDTVQPDEDCVAALIRCVQEIVTNAIRHSGAENLSIHVEQAEAGRVTLTAQDDGRGASLLRLGNGLTGVRERVEQLGGAVSFDTRSGFRVSAQVPAR